MSLSTDRAVMCVAAVALAASVAGVSAQSAPALSALTVPATSLPNECHLTPPPAPSASPRPAPVILPDGGVIRPGEFPNPWFGTEYKYIVQVRQAIDRMPPVHLPDGPPLDQKETRTLLSTLKGDVAEAYRASYDTEFVGRILVQAVRYTDAKWATPGEGRIVRGSTVILVAGNPQGECFNAVRNYIQSLK